MYADKFTYPIDITSYDGVRPYLALRLVSARSREDLISVCPSGSFLDLNTLVYICPEPCEGPCGTVRTIPVSRDMLQSWGITEDRLFSDAAVNTPFLMPPCIRTLEDTLEAARTDWEEMPSMDPADDFSCGLYVLTNRSGFYGAACMMYPGLMEEIYRCLGPYYVLPCSIHELILAPDHEALTLSGLADIVHKVNREVLEDNDYLSDSVYYCGESGLCLPQRESLRDPALCGLS